MPVSDVIGTLKGKTAIEMFRKFLELRKSYWGSHFWGRGYYANTAEKNEAMIREYIKDQGKLHKFENQGRLLM